MGCLTGAKFTMSAMLLHQEDHDEPLDEFGEWTDSQDPVTGEIVRVWVPGDIADDPLTPYNETQSERFKCLARGIISSGVGGVGSNEQFSKTYDNIDYVHMWTPSSVKISKRDRVTNITDNKGHVIWLDIEDGTPRATIFNVNGITPVLDPFNRHTQNFVILKRADAA